MDQYRELAERLRGVMSPTTATLMQGIVRSVEGDTCTVEVGGLDIPDVRLRASGAPVERAYLITPAIGSAVIVGSLTGDLTELVVLAVDSASSISISGGALGGMVIVGGLTRQLNAIERDLNTLRRAFASWVVAPSDGGAALKAATAQWVASTLRESAPSDYENTDIKH